MKKILIALVVLGSSFSLSAQKDNAIDKYFSQYENDTAFAKVKINAKMFELFTEMEGSTEEQKAMQETIGKLKGLKMLELDNDPRVEALYKEAIKKMNKNYEVLMEIEDEEKITFYIDESGGIIKELVMVMGGQNEFMILSLEGDIDLKEISKLSKSVNISGMEKLESVEDAE
ncbi:MAG: hypothetical protein SchgKO_11950 [Schleiferiaceae bacterium]